MRASIAFTPIPIDLGEAVLGVLEPKPVLVTARNTGQTTVSEIEIMVRGEGAAFVQLAIDGPGGPGVWSAAGEGIAPKVKALRPTDALTFWARGNFPMDTAENEYDFDIVFAAVSR